MIRVSSTEFVENSLLYQDAALSDVVVVTRDGRDATVMISVEEYRRLRRQDRHVVVADGPEDEADIGRQASLLKGTPEETDALAFIEAVGDWSGRA